MNLDEILKKVKSLNETTRVIINKVPLEKCINWSYDESRGEICNSSKSFFQIKGIKKIKNGEVVLEQPIIIQNEIGYLGIIRKRINGEYYYLMQYKIEPGNINKIQISPTIQATKSNFTQKHGGKKPAYLDYFVNANRYKIVVDQIQSEQSSRFLGKRNRNIIVEVDEDESVECLPSHDWMTLRQIKTLMRYDNLVNMDTRTVLSCLPAEFEDYAAENFKDKALYKSMKYGSGINYFPQLYQYINNVKMFDDCDTKMVSLGELDTWSMVGGEIVSNTPYSFKVVFCDIEIEGREVKHWCQPLFEAMGIADFGLITCVENGVRLFLVKCRKEIGCFDTIEIGPSVQKEYVSLEEKDAVEAFFYKKVNLGKGIIFDTLLSEEGGRFYQEQNRNIVIEVDKREIDDLPDGYFWLDYKTLNTLVQVNNTLNIQLRNLLSVLEF
ncbi:MAG: NDP-hexose 2,3-dehydratase family protein [Ruminiclostridium sp.]|nr:NDP-hexose 2,3-dehydratase family protein [Ruminiclostridium sp.]